MSKNQVFLKVKYNFLIIIFRDIHTSCKGHSVQNVATAAQIFSKTVSSCFFLAGKPALAYFCQTINDGFDVMNSSKIFHRYNKLKCALGINEEQQRDALMKMEQLLLSMTFGNSSGNRSRHQMMPFQKGMIVAIRSTLILFEQLRKEGFRYLMTTKVSVCNQGGGITGSVNKTGRC